MSRNPLPPVLIPVLEAVLLALLLCPCLLAQSQPAADSDPTPALTAALSAACREDSAKFSVYLTVANSAAFNKLPSDERISLMERFVLLDTPGRPLLSTSTDGRQELRCEATDATQEFTLGAPRVHDNLAYVDITIATGETIRVGLVREDGNWKLLSLGLLLIDIPALQKEWDVQALKAREQSAIDALQDIAQAVETYQRAFGKLPDSLAQLGPPAQGGVSPSAAKLIDAALAAGANNGYKFRYRVVTPAGSENPGFEIAALPEQYGKSGNRSFLLDKDGKVHGADKKGAVATADDPVVTGEDAGTP
ncbi:MAG: hypothetical protein WBE86_03105 [Candidatus Acidiferrales bacterium]